MRIPGEIKALNQWHCWVNKNGTKLPVQVNGSAAKSNDPQTWSSYESASHNSFRFAGLAFELTDPYCGIDLDNCIDDDGGVKDWAKPIVEALTPIAYGEVSPSGTGIKFLTRARKPEAARCVAKLGSEAKEQLECYDNRRFWAMTGDVWGTATEIADGQGVIDELCSAHLNGNHSAPPAPRRHVTPAPVDVSDQLLVRARAYIDSCEQAVPGNRNNQAFNVAGNLWEVTEDGRRPTLDQLMEYMRLWNSRNYDPLPEKELESVTLSATRNGTRRETKESRPYVPPTPEELGVDVDLDKLLDALTGRSSFPKDCLEIPGLIGDIVRHNLNTAHYPLDELAVAGAISLMSVITGGKAEGFRCRTNLYIAGLAPSGGGKDYSRKINRTILLHAGHPEVVGPERIGSHAGIVSAMAENWNTLFQIDEIGRLLATMQSARQSPHLFNIASVLMQLYSSADGIWQADAYADRKKVKTLDHPHCVVYGSSVPGGFWESLSKENLSDGLIGRFLVFENPDYVDYVMAEESPIPESIIERTRNWLELKTHDGNLAAHDAAHPRKVTATEEAKDRLHTHAVAISTRRKTEDTIDAAIWSRHAEKTNKLAVLFACSRWNGTEDDWPVVTLEDAGRAVRLNNYLTRRMLRQSGQYVFESQTEHDILKVMRKIRERTRWPRYELTRALRWLRPRDRKEIFAELFESGEIRIVEEEQTEEEKAGPGRPKSWISAVSRS